MDSKTEIIELVKSFLEEDKLRIEVIMQKDGVKKIVITPITPVESFASKTEATVEVQDNIECQVVEILHQIGCPANLKGYRFIREAIMMCYNNVEYVDNITKLLYPEIAKKFDTTSSRVERAIRHSIEVMWSKGNMKKIKEIFEYTVSDQKGKPTNSEFIALIADTLHLHNR